MHGFEIVTKYSRARLITLQSAHGRCVPGHYFNNKLLFFLESRIEDLQQTRHSSLAVVYTESEINCKDPKMSYTLFSIQSFQQSMLQISIFSVVVDQLPNMVYPMQCHGQLSLHCKAISING